MGDVCEILILFKYSKSLKHDSFWSSFTHPHVFQNPYDLSSVRPSVILVKKANATRKQMFRRIPRLWV